MLLKRLTWQKGSGWSAPWPVGIDSPTTPAVMFGGNPAEDCRDAIAEVAGRLPQSVLLGCSTAGEIFDAHVQDVSLSVAIARFDEVTLRKTSLPGGGLIPPKTPAASSPKGQPPWDGPAAAVPCTTRR